jgi:hypothetical protein
MTEVWQDDVLVTQQENEDLHPPWTALDAPTWLTERPVEGEPDYSPDEEELIRELNPNLAD